MARTRRQKIGTEQNVNETKRPGVIHTAAYVRLSTPNSGHDTDDSIQTQTSLIVDFIEQHPDLTLSDIYVDNGYSGTTFQRPEFMRLMDDVRTGKVGCIVVKDLSRLGRNYLEAGYYLETLFPRLNIRFIAITDEFDSARPSDRDSLSVPIKNMVNAMYAKEASQKALVTAKMRRNREGVLPNGTPPYGYVANQNKTQYLPDPRTAPYVKMIFYWRKIGLGPSEIARRLTLLGAVTPNQYRMLPEEIDTITPEKWTNYKVRNILANPVYTGNLYFGRIHCALYKEEKEHKTKREQWTVHQNTHEPLVTQEDYDYIQEMQSKSRSSLAKKEEQNIKDRKRLQPEFPGLVYCAECGRRMNFRRYMHETTDHKEKTITCYQCGKRDGENPCQGHIVFGDFLKVVVMDQIVFLIETMCDRTKVIKQIGKANNQSSYLRSIKKKIIALDKKIEDLEEKQSLLYENYVEGLVDVEDYYELKTKMIADKQGLQENVNQYRQEEQKMTETMNQYVDLTEHLEKMFSSREFNQKVILELVERIYVSGTGRIEIQFKFHDVIQTIEQLWEEEKDDCILS